jgi:hypothetical protein
MKQIYRNALGNYQYTDTLGDTARAEEIFAQAQTCLEERMMPGAAWQDMRMNGYSFVECLEALAVVTAWAYGQTPEEFWNKPAFEFVS